MLGFIRKSPLHSAVVVTMSSISLLFSWIGGGVLALTLLTHSWQECVKVYLIAALPYIFLAFMGHSQGFVTVFLCHFGWLLLMTWLLKSFNQLSLVLAALAVTSVVIIGTVYLINPDINDYWLKLVDDLLKNPDSPFNQWSINPDMLSQLHSTKPWIGSFMTGGVVAFVLLHVITSLALGRYWQAKYLDVSGVGEEFLNLRLPKFLSLFAVAVFVVAMFTHSLISLLPPLLCIIALPGISVCHYYLRQNYKFALWSFYIVLALLFSYAVPVLCLIAIADSWFSLRKKAVNKDT